MIQRYMLTAIFLAMVPAQVIAAPSARAPRAGAKLDAAFWSKFGAPKVPLGTKWTYEAKFTLLDFSDPASGNPEVAEDTFTAAAGGKVDGSDDLQGTPRLDLFMLRADLTAPTAPNDLITWMSAGPETITVRAGKFSGAAKVSRKANGWQFTEWYGSGVGLLKRISTKEFSNGIERRMVELKAFKLGK